MSRQEGQVSVSAGRLLLHVCCAPCAPHVLDTLREAGYEPTAFFFNPNIHPEEEYSRRLDELRRHCEAEGIPLIEGRRDTVGWRAAVAGRENDPEGGDRCRLCIGFRLAEAASTAAANGMKTFAATLTVSPHKNAAVVNAAGRAAAAVEGVVFLEADFKKRDGFKKSCETARRRGFYRQDYCGCEFSMEARQKRPAGGD